jgi:hypothetical protein
MRARFDEAREERNTVKAARVSSDCRTLVEIHPDDVVNFAAQQRPR